MNRRSFFTKLPFMGAALAAGVTIPEPKPKVDYILTLGGAPQCPHCLMAFDCSIRTDEQGKYLNWDPETQTVTVEHPHRHRPKIYVPHDCVNAGMKFRFKLPRVTAEVVS